MYVGDNPRALASGVSYVQVDKHGITILYHQHQCRPCTSRDNTLSGHRRASIYAYVCMYYLILHVNMYWVIWINFEIFCAKVGKDGIMIIITPFSG